MGFSLKHKSNDFKFIRRIMRLNFKLIKQDLKTVVPVLVFVALFIAAYNFILGKICPMRMVFGIPCPSCGITRAFLLVLQGEFYEATVMHPLWIVLILLLLAFLAVRYFVQDENKSKKLVQMIKVCFAVATVLCVVYYIYRMIMWYPDRAPMIYDSENLINRIRG